MATRPTKPHAQYIMDDGIADAPNMLAPPPAPMARDLPQLTPEIVEELKAAMDASGLPLKMYKVTFDKDTFIIRPLMQCDWLQVEKFAQSNQGGVRQDQIDRKVIEYGLVWPQEVLHPLTWEVQRAGLQKALSDNIMSRSGFMVNGLEQGEFIKVEPLFAVEPSPRPSQEVIDDLRSRESWVLRLVFLDGDWFIIRPLSRGEWTAISKLGDDKDIDVLVTEKVCLWSKEFPGKPDFHAHVAGVPSTLSAIAMQISGFSAQAQVEEL